MSDKIIEPTADELRRYGRDSAMGDGVLRLSKEVPGRVFSVTVTFGPPLHRAAATAPRTPDLNASMVVCPEAVTDTPDERERP